MIFKNKKNKKVALFAGLLILFFFTLFYYQKHPLETTVIFISKNGGKRQILTAELAVTGKERYRGLSGKKSMPKNKGMLFVFDHKEKYGFVMRDMHFPLDFIWIADRRVVDITKNAPVEKHEPLTSYQPKIPVDLVFEVNAGVVDKLGIAIGDQVKIEN